MKTWIMGGRVYISGRMEETGLLLENGRIKGFCSNREPDQGDVVYDARGAYVVPGFVDIHTHGGAGVDVNGASREDFQRLGHFFASQGTTSWLCSILTDTCEQTLYTIREAVAHKKEHKNCANLAGIHLEGPFLSREYKGAMPEHLLRLPDVELVAEYQKAAEGNIRYITISPEVPGAAESIPAFKEMGIAVAIGHSGADYETAWKCIHNGAVSGTHVMNAMKLVHQHAPAIMGAVLESDIYCEAICDGRHLHPGTVRFLIKMKGMDRMVGITDSIMAAGLPDGNYKLGVNDVVVVDGDARLKDGTRAGSTLTTGQALKNVIAFTGKTLAQVLPMFTENPAKVIGLEHRIGSLEPGKDADVVILDSDYNVKDTFVKGHRIV